MSMLELVLTLATLLCTLTAGFVFAFATVVMPGIGKMSDRGFIRSFQVIDGVIQNGQPAFGLVWMGSVVALVASAALGAWHLEGLPRALVVVSALAYVVGVQLPTFRVNVPLNNTLQVVDVEAMEDDALASARVIFERRWVRWNLIRTVVAIGVSATLMGVLLAL